MGEEPQDHPDELLNRDAAARVVETHVSTLFFFGDRVYKLRKPVQFGFLDFRLRATREADCQREVMLNRRLAPDVYLGVATITCDGKPIDHMVVMRRMPEDRRLSAVAQQGADLDDWLLKVAQALASFHRGAERSPDISAAATGSALRADWERNFVETSSFVGPILDEATEAKIQALALRWIDGREALLSERIALGRVCDGHGDLQAEDIFCLDDGVRILDCVEFSDALRHCDVVADVAFLVMDLERLGHHRAATSLLLKYKDLAEDRFPETLVHHYCASRAYVRAKVACLRSAQGEDGAKAAARQLHDLALSFLRQARVTLVVVGGLPGSGKSTLARGLAGARDWTVFRSDELRLEIGVAEPVSGYRTGRYSPAITTKVYEELLRQAERLLESGYSVILDASWVDAGRRGAAQSVAERTSSDLVELCCDVSHEIARERIERRLAEHADLSEATPEVSAAMSLVMDPWPSATVIDTFGAPSKALALALRALGD